MKPAADELDPPFGSSSPSSGVDRVLFTRRNSGQHLSARVSCRAPDSTCRRCAAPRTVSWTTLALGVVARGYPLMRAHFPRCFVDVNREPYELDPRMFEGRLALLRQQPVRCESRAGSALSPAWVGDAQEIYDQRISVDDALRRIENLYSPIIARCAGCFTRVHREFGAGHDDRLPFDAVVHRTEGRPPRRRRGAGRSLPVRAVSPWCQR